MTIEIEEKTELEVTADLLSYVPDKYQKNVGYFIWDFFRAVGKVFVNLWDKLSYLTAFYNIENLDYDDLVKFVYQRAGIEAHTATYAYGDITVSTGSASVDTTSIFETESGLQFKSLETKSVSANDTITVQCLTKGVIGNVPAQTVTVSKVNGITVTNLDAFTGGYEDESKESIIDRYLTKIRKPISSGNIYHYKYWAKEVSGVGAAKIKPLWNGNNTVKVIIVDSNYGPANSTLVDSVQDYIDPYELVDTVKVGWGCGNGQAPIGAYCTVESAQTLNLSVTVSVILKTGADETETKAKIASNINDYLKSLIETVFAQETSTVYVSYAAIGAAIFNTDGVLDYANLLLNGDNDNILIADTSTYCQCPVLNTLTVTVV